MPKLTRSVPRWRICIGGAIAASLALATACSSSSSSSNSAGGGTTAATSATQEQSSGGGSLTTVRVGADTDTGALPLWVAMDEGMFAKHGLKVKYQEVDNISSFPAILGKSLDFAYLTPNGVIQAAAHHISVTEVAGTKVVSKKSPNGYLFVAKNSKVHDLSQLKGKTIGALTIAGTLNYGTLKMLDEAGVPPESVKVVTVSGPVQEAQLTAGRVDAVETVVPFSIQIEKAGGRAIGFPFQAAAKEISPTAWGASADWAADHKKVVGEFQASLADAISYIDSHPADAAAITAKYTHISLSLVKQFPKVDYDAAVRPQDLPVWLDLMRKYGGFRGNVDLSKLTFSS